MSNPMLLVLAVVATISVVVNIVLGILLVTQ
jgi:hypothetical protein